MASKKKLLQAAAGAAGGEALDVDDVFSTYLYDGNGSSQTITNNIDLSSEGGLIWIKQRNASRSHYLVDTERGKDQWLSSDLTAEQQNFTILLDSFNTDGFTLETGNPRTNSSGNTYASWTFRKAPKFFDVVTYTGTGVNRTISHNLGSTPGMIIVKRTDSTSDWAVYHKDLNGGVNPATKFIRLNLANAESANLGYWNDTEPTDSVFSVGINSYTNHNGGTYVAYLFAHNDGDGEFGPDADQDIIKCGSYAINASDHVEDLGFEPQWVMTKSTNTSGQWIMVDNMRGMGVNREANQDKVLRANLNSAEETNNGPVITPTGFVWPYDGGNAAANGEQGIYIAIRRGPLAAPESATDVFGVNERLGGYPTPTLINTGNVVDLLIGKRAESSGGGETYFWDRLRGGTRYLQGDSTAAETGSTEYIEFDTNEGFREGFFNTSHTQIHWTWKRAPSFFDVVAYDGGNGSSINHNLGVTPEMYWIKCRSDGSTNRGWAVYHKDATTQASKYLRLDTSDALLSLGVFNNGTIDASTFSANNGYSIVNESGQTYIAYLFATVAGVSKVGSYTGTGSDQTIDCGFANGARFVLAKRSSTSGIWGLFDTTRGIVAGNDPLLRLNATNAESSSDYIDPHSSGFTWPGEGGGFNTSGITYIFYAIA